MNRHGLRRPLVVTPGEPAGIGCEITIKAWQQQAAPFCLIESPDHVQRVARLIGCDIPINVIDSPAAFDPDRPGLAVIAIDWPVAPVFGVPDPANAQQVITAISAAAAWCRSGEAAGMVTNPIQKSTLYEAGFSYPGHTEFLASLGNVAPGGPLMMLACDSLRVVPATIHIPVAAVAGTLSQDLLIEQIRLLHHSLQKQFAIATPRIAVCGLNPHAGEAGTIGTEERHIINPALDALRNDGINVSGPHPADTLFHEDARKTYDAVVGMYHDQVLIPLKTIDFYQGVNITLGLDFIRTSPDHGTGLPIAGRGMARADSLLAAITHAAALARTVA